MGGIQPCCVNRGDAAEKNKAVGLEGASPATQSSTPGTRRNSRTCGVAYDAEDYLGFSATYWDAYETEEEQNSRSSWRFGIDVMPEEYFTLTGKPPDRTTPELEPCWSPTAAMRAADDGSSPQLGFGLPPVATNPADVDLVMMAAREYWEKKVNDPKELKALGDDFVKKIRDGFPELEEWATREHAARMLRAEVHVVEIATERLIKAIECRVRGREIYNSFLCKTIGGDMRCIGRDQDRRTVMYWCAGSQTENLKVIIPQILITIEAAIKLSESNDSKICLIADMQNYRTMHNMDYYAFKEIGDYLGSVYAERVFFIMVVDFSPIVRMAWRLIKPLLNERTQAKISFVCEAEARKTLSAKTEKATFARLETAFDINRDKLSTKQERMEHARRTSICDVPLGSIIEKAG
jgi:hypothetical protein